MLAVQPQSWSGQCQPQNRDKTGEKEKGDNTYRTWEMSQISGQEDQKQRRTKIDIKRKRDEDVKFEEAEIIIWEKKKKKMMMFDNGKNF